MPAFITSMKRSITVKNLRLLIAAIGGVAILFFAQFDFAASMQTRGDYAAALDRASVAYKDARAKCDVLAGHDKDMCVVEAQAAEKRAKASADVDYKGTTKSKTDRRISNTYADYMVARVACDSKPGQERKACVKQAHATQLKLVAEAKADKTTAGAQADAREDARETQYKVALAKCEPMPAVAKDTCVVSAKSNFGK
jgi:hypothetical protein